MSDTGLAWNPDRYLRFKEQRFAPFDDLVDLVETKPEMKVVDLGCGTGELTRRLADSLTGADVVGVDSSTAMLERSREFEREGLRFEHGDLAAYPGRFDLVVSNAALHWVDDQADIVASVFAMLAPGGQLAVQVPANHDHPSHTLARDVAASEPFSDALGGWNRGRPVLDPEEYATLLWQLGAVDVVAFQKVYLHELESSDAIVEWMRGTGLLAYLERLPEALREPFVAEYRRRIAQRFPGSPVLFTFNRTFFCARRPDPA
ncbi:MAG: methyltransferase domain-containing protein [Acidimicrobiia bacterium]|nr:methyltransferase domain-containing protein [Acidimicrobiia bacterium]